MASVEDDDLADDQLDFPILLPLNPGKLRSKEAAGRKRRDRNGFRRWPSPTEPMDKPFPAAVRQQGPPPEDLRPIVEWFEGQEDARERMGWVFRDSLDSMFDGQRSGRWCYQQVTSKTERTHLGTTIEVNFTNEFDIPNGKHLDWKIAGQDVDCKYAVKFGTWQIPMEMYLCDDHKGRSGVADHPAFVTWVSDDASQWAAGLVRITDDMLAFRKDKTGRSYNRDNKRRIPVANLHMIHWLFGGLQTDLPRNTILQMDESRRQRVFADGRSGQKRINALFRENQRELIHRAVVLTVAQQDDGPKRPRDARKLLRPEGIFILGHQGEHPQMARDLGLPVPSKGEWMSVTLVDAEEMADRKRCTYLGRKWAIAQPGDNVVALPDPPKNSKEADDEGGDDE